MFSGLDRPPDCETLEYAWLVEIQLGILSGRLTMPQVRYVMYALESVSGLNYVVRSMHFF